jgi:hypothetical protein
MALKRRKDDVMKPSGRIIDDFLFSTGLFFTLLCVVDEVIYFSTTDVTRNFFLPICLGIGLSFMFIGWSRGGHFRYSWRRGILTGMPTSCVVGDVILLIVLLFSFSHASPLDSAHIVLVGIYLLGIIVGLTLIALGIRRMATTQISSAD